MRCPRIGRLPDRTVAWVIGGHRSGAVRYITRRRPPAGHTRGSPRRSSSGTRQSSRAGRGPEYHPPIDDRAAAGGCAWRPGPARCQPRRSGLPGGTSAIALARPMLMAGSVPHGPSSVAREPIPHRSPQAMSRSSHRHIPRLHRDAPDARARHTSAKPWSGARLIRACSGSKSRVGRATARGSRKPPGRPLPFTRRRVLPRLQRAHYSLLSHRRQGRPSQPVHSAPKL